MLLGGMLASCVPAYAQFVGNQMDPNARHWRPEAPAAAAPKPKKSVEESLKPPCKEGMIAVVLGDGVTVRCQPDM